MINYLIMEDNLNDLLIYKNIIDKVMMNYDINYNISIIDRYTKTINDFLENDSFKIYILHLEKHKKTKELIKKIREEIPGVIIRTTLIVGFPTEKEEEFEELYSFVKDSKFDRLGAFSFSSEEGTAASRIKEQVADDIKEERKNKK